MPSPPVSQIQKEADVISKNMPFKIFLDHYPPSPLHRRPKKKDTRSKTDWTTSSWSERCNTTVDTQVPGDGGAGVSFADEVSWLLPIQEDEKRGW